MSCRLMKSQTSDMMTQWAPRRRTICSRFVIFTCAYSYSNILAARRENRSSWIQKCWRAATKLQDSSLHDACFGNKTLWYGISVQICSWTQRASINWCCTKYSFFHFLNIIYSRHDTQTINTRLNCAKISLEVVQASARMDWDASSFIQLTRNSRTSHHM